MITKTIAVILKGYPRLSETFIAQELLGLERAGVRLRLFSMRHPTDKDAHPVHGAIQAPVSYLPEYLHHEPWRVLRAWWQARRLPGYRSAQSRFLADLLDDPARNRARRWGQALVLAAELPADVGHLHAHFIHTPGSVASYASMLTGLPWTCSAHAKDIWTTGDAELTSKLNEAQYVVVCNKAGHERLRKLAPDPQRVHFSYHGLDLERFGRAPRERPPRNGTGEPVELLTVCRAVEKKGLDILLKALAMLPEGLEWRWTHVGAGELVSGLNSEAEALGLGGRVFWRGALPQTGVLDLYRKSDLFVLPCRIAADGDRDGLPNVLLEAQSQGLACVSSDVSGIPELIENGVTGLLVPPDDPCALAGALARAISDPGLRERFGRAGEVRVRTYFDHQKSINDLLGLFSGAAPTRQQQPEKIDA